MRNKEYRLKEAPESICKYSPYYRSYLSDLLFLFRPLHPHHCRGLQYNLTEVDLADALEQNWAELVDHSSYSLYSSVCHVTVNSLNH